MKQMILAAVALVVFSLVACGGDDDDSDSAGAEPSAIEVGSPFEVDGEDMPFAVTGATLVTFRSAHVLGSVNDDAFPCGGAVSPRGQFVAVVFDVENNTSGEIQISSPVESFRLTDGERTWERAADPCALAANAAALLGANQPAAYLGAGLRDSSAITFEVPTDATDLALVSELLSVGVAIEPEPFAGE